MKARAIRFTKYGKCKITTPKTYLWFKISFEVCRLWYPRRVDYIREFLIIQVRVYASHFPPHPIDFLSIFPNITRTTYKTQLNGVSVLCLSFHRFWGTHILTSPLTIKNLLTTLDKWYCHRCVKLICHPPQSQEGQQRPAAVFLWGVLFPRKFWGYSLVPLSLVTGVSVCGIQATNLNVNLTYSQSGEGFWAGCKWPGTVRAAP